MPMDIRTYLGGRVQGARKACKLTQQELSDQTGVSIKMIQGIESGSVNPSYGILFPIVNRLGLTTSDLFNVEADEHDEEINRFLGIVSLESSGRVPVLIRWCCLIRWIFLLNSY